MENLELPANPENKTVVQVEEITNTHAVEIYKGASTLELEKADQEKLFASFEMEQYEIRPDGHIYVPQALIRGRLNSVVGVGQWAIVLLRDRVEQLNEKSYKLFYDGALLIRGKFVSRSTGEATYFTTNPNQSWASALESGKSDCMVRCVKDLGIALEVYQPAFVRKWQKEYAKRVWVQDRQERKVMWRRIDVDPFNNETGDWQAKFSVPGHEPKKPIEATKINPVSREWLDQIDDCKNLTDLTALYNMNKKDIDAWPELFKAFKDRQAKLKTPVKK